MAITRMTWLEIENVVADSVREQYLKMQTDKEKYQFCQDIRTANIQLSELSRNNVNYDLPCMGEAYALKYHLQRMDNIYISLSRINAKVSLSPNMQILDVGSGTGSGTMAISYWIGRNFKVVPTNLHFYCVEPSQPMKYTASYLLPNFLNKMRENNQQTSNERAFSWRHCVGKTIEQCTQAVVRERFDLIIFSYTFSVQKPTEWDKTKDHVVKIVNQLKPGGVVMFLTPTKPADKQKMIEEIELRLKSGLKPVAVTPISRGIKYAPDKRPSRVVELRREINRECRRFKIEDAFGEKPEMDDPYYGFYGKLTAFSK